MISFKTRKRHKIKYEYFFKPLVEGEQRYILDVDVMKDGEVECLVCGLIFMGFGPLKIHYRSCNVNGPWNCLVCGKEFENKRLLGKHYNRHEEVVKRKQNQSNLIKCSLCDLVCKGTHKLKLHYKTHGSGPFKCDTCGDLIEDLKSMREHVKSHNESTCFLCNEKFPTLNKMIAHRKIHGQGPFTCKVCGKVRKGMKSIRQHMNNHDNEVHCEICAKKMTVDKLRHHMGYHTGKQFLYSCHLGCKKCFKNKILLIICYIFRFDQEIIVLNAPLN